MNDTNLSLIISVVAILVAVFSPLLTSLIDNLFKRKEQIRRFHLEHRAEVIENYIRYAGALNQMSSDIEDFRSYGKYSKEIYLYLPEKFWNNIDSIDNALKNYHYKEAALSLAELCKQLNEYHPRFKQHRRNYKQK